MDIDILNASKAHADEALLRETKKLDINATGMLKACWILAREESVDAERL